MKEIFDNNTHSGFRRMLGLTAVSCLLMVSFTGCFGGDKVPETSAPTDPPILLETDPTEAPTEVPTEAPAATPNVTVEGKIVTVTGAPVEVRSAIAPDGVVIGRLEVGSQSEIIRQFELDGINWALVREGWICLDNVDLDSITEVEDDDDRVSVVPDDRDDAPAQPTTPPRPSNNGGNNASNQGAVPVNQTGTITARELNIRSEPSTSGKIVGSLKQGSRVTVIEKKGDWGHINSGWISLNYVSFSGNAGGNTNNGGTANNGTVIARGVVTVNGLNVRSGAGINNAAVATYNYGDRVEIYEKATVGDATWGKTAKGWVAMGYVYLDGARTAEAVMGRVTGDVVNVRTGPGTGYQVATVVRAGDTVEILAQFKIGDTMWGCMSNGWISMDFVSTN